MTNWVLYRQTPCPVCGRADSGCKATNQEQHTILCRDGSDLTKEGVYKGKKVLDYICQLAETKCAAFSLWVHQDHVGRTSSPGKLRAIYEAARSGGIASNPDQTSSIDKREPFSVSVEIRSRLYEHIREELRGRGLLKLSDPHLNNIADRLDRPPSDELRQKLLDAGYLSITRPVIIPLGLDPVPGAYLTDAGTWEWRPRKGLYMPMRNHLGQQICFEITSGRGSYYPDSSSDPGRCRFHVDGEQPLSWCLPMGTSVDPPPGGYTEIWLTEGRGMKPAVTSQLYGKPVLGCGGSFDGSRSPLQLLAACRSLHPAGRLVLMADGGWLANRNVLCAMTRVVTVLRQQGFNPLIGAVTEAAAAWNHRAKNLAFVDSEGTVRTGAAPDDVPDFLVWQMAREAQPLEAWLDDSRTTDTARASVQAELSKIEAEGKEVAQIQRKASANSRAEHHLRPEKLTSTLPVESFADAQRIPAWIHEASELLLVNAEQVEAWRYATLLPAFRDLSDAGDLSEEQLLLFLAVCEQVRGLVSNASELRNLGLEALRRRFPNLDDKGCSILLSKGQRLFEQRFPSPSKPILVVDASPTGSGKSHDFVVRGERLRRGLVGQQAGVQIFVSDSYRSPQIPGLGDWIELPARHMGIEAKRFADGSERRRRVRDPEDADSPDGWQLVEAPTCRFAHEMSRIMAKGLGIDSLGFFCREHCPHRPSTDDGFGGDDSCEWPRQMAALVKEVARPGSFRDESLQRIRTSMGGLLGMLSYSRLDNRGDFLAGVILGIDEAPQLLNAAVQHYRIGSQDLIHMRQALRTWFGPEASAVDLELADGLLRAASELLIAPSSSPKDFGLPPGECRSDKEVRTALARIVSAYATPAGAVELPKCWYGRGHAQDQVLNALCLESGFETRADAISMLAPPVLPVLLRALMPDLLPGPRTSLSVEVLRTPRKNKHERGNRVLVLSEINPAVAEALKRVHCSFVLDATEVPEDLPRMIGLQPGDVHMSVVRAEGGIGISPAMSGSSLVQVACLGDLTRQRTEHQTMLRNQTVDAWIAKLGVEGVIERKEEVGVLDHGQFCRRGQDNEQPWLTVAARGGNQFQLVKGLVLIGMPITNLGGFSVQLELMFGVEAAEMGSDLFRRRLNHKVWTELMQGLGRARANRRPGEQIRVLLLSATDLSRAFPVDALPTVVSLKELLPTVELNDQAGTAYSKVMTQLLEVFKAGEVGPKTLAEAARLVKVNRQTLQRALKERGFNFEQLRAQVLSQNGGGLLSDFA